MAIRFVSQVQLGGLFLIDDVKNIIIKRFDNVPFVDRYEESRWWERNGDSWMTPGFWGPRGHHMDKNFSNYTKPLPDGIGMEFKGKQYIDLGLTPDGYRMWRGIDKLQDSHDVALKQIYG